MTSERIDIFMEKLRVDNGKTYNSFVNGFGMKYRLNREDLEDVWQTVLSNLTSENSKRLDSHKYRISNKVGIANSS